MENGIIKLYTKYCSPNLKEKKSEGQKMKLFLALGKTKFHSNEGVFLIDVFE